MGIRPSGLGERESPRQYEEESGEEAEVGERCPLAAPFSLTGSEFCVDVPLDEGMPDFDSAD